MTHTQDSFLQYDFFKNINMDDPFFDSLKNDYIEFEEWFKRKRENKAYYYQDEDRNIQAFLYLKVEDEPLDDMYPQFPSRKRIKIGTLKINPHGTKLGERFLKKAFDHAVHNDIKELYLTVFEKHEGLIHLLEKYGFYHGANKQTNSGIERVYFKDLAAEVYEDPVSSYPLINTNNQTPHLLSIYPEFHTRLFPDSILHNEHFNLIEDVSHTNSIEKIYVGYASGLQDINPGDPIIIYRTTDQEGNALYRSVATSLCTAVEVHTKDSFESLDGFLEFCKGRTVFNKNELINSYNKENLTVIKMVYNQAFSNRVIRKELIEVCGLNRYDYWGIMSLEYRQFECVLREGGIHESFIIN